MKTLSTICFCMMLLVCLPQGVSAQDIVLPIEAPGFSLPDLNGREVSMESYRGSYLVLHIATTWCPFCNAEAPYLQQLSENYAPQNVKVLIIDVKEPGSLVNEKLQEKFEFTFPILLDEDGSVAASFAPEGVLPDLARDEVMLASNMIIDPDGQIVFMSLLDSKNFDARLEALRSKLDDLLASH